jgi:hypothetical protein
LQISSQGRACTSGLSPTATWLSIVTATHTAWETSQLALQLTPAATVLLACKPAVMSLPVLLTGLLMVLAIRVSRALWPASPNQGLVTTGSPRSSALWATSMLLGTMNPAGGVGGASAHLTILQVRCHRTTAHWGLATAFTAMASLNVPWVRVRTPRLSSCTSAGGKLNNCAAQCDITVYVMQHCMR